MSRDIIDSVSVISDDHPLHGGGEGVGGGPGPGVSQAGREDILIDLSTEWPHCLCFSYN